MAEYSSSFVIDNKTRKTRPVKTDLLVLSDQENKVNSKGSIKKHNVENLKDFSSYSLLDDFAGSLTDFITFYEAQTAKLTLRLDTNYTATANITANFTLKACGGVISDGGSYSITVNGQIEDTMFKMFDSTANVSLGTDNHFARPEWFGGIGDGDGAGGGTDNTQAIATVCQCFSSGGTVKFADGIYEVTQGNGADIIENVGANMTIEGIYGKTFFYNTTANDNRFYAVFGADSKENISFRDVGFINGTVGISIQDSDNILVDHCQFLGKRATNNFANKACIVAGGENFIFKNNYVENLEFGCYLGLPSHITKKVGVYGNTFKNTETSTNALYPVGVYAYFVDDLIITDNYFENILPPDNATDGYGLYEGDGSCRSIIFSNNTSVHNHATITKYTGAYASRSTKFIVTNNNFISVGAAYARHIVTSYQNAIADYEVVINGNLIKNEASGLQSMYLDGDATYYGKFRIANNTVNKGQIYLLPTQLTDYKLDGNYIGYSNEAGVKIVALAAVKDNIHLVNNHIEYCQHSAIEATYIQRSRFINNYILDCNQATRAAEAGAGIYLNTSSYGGEFRGNIIRRTDNKMTNAIANTNNLYLYKNILRDNNFDGWNGGTVILNRIGYSNAPTTGIDWVYGDMVEDYFPSVGSAWGYMCVDTRRTTINGNFITGNTVITVTDITGITTSHVVAILLDNGNYQFSTISLIAGSDITVDALTANASTGNALFFFRFGTMPNLA